MVSSCSRCTRGCASLASYDSNGRVTEQAQADSGVFGFDYTLDGSGQVTQTDLTDPEGHVERTTFNGDGYALTHVEALGTALERTTTFTRASGSNLLSRVEDALSREAEYTYEANANLTSVARLVGTTDETTTWFTYEPAFNQVASVTDPLRRATTFTHDTLGRLMTVTDPAESPNHVHLQPRRAAADRDGCAEPHHRLRLPARGFDIDHESAVADHHTPLR